MINKQTTLDLNGPILSFVQNPQSIKVCAGTAVTFIGIATATFPQNQTNFSTNTGIITYRWYDQNGPLFDDPPSSGGDGVTISGSGTTTLTLYNIRSSKNLYVRADYIPSAYGLPDVPITVGSARSTANAINEPINSTTITLDTIPSLEIISEPLDVVVSKGVSATFQTLAALTDGTNNSITYQWQLNGQDINDGIITTTNTVPASSTLTIIDDSTNQSTVIDFSKISTYSNFITGRTYTLVSNSNLTAKLTASGAAGGSSISRNVVGGSGGSSTGNFVFVSGQTYRLIIGGKGVNGGIGGYAGGGNGGGGTGKGGGGGGYTGLFLNSVTRANAIIIAGGGGGGANDPATGGDGGGLSGSGRGSSRDGTGGTQSSGGSAGGSDGSPGSPGSSLQGGAGAAGGGGGYFGGGGGQSYNGCCADGSGGGGSGYLHPTLLTNASTSNGSGSATDGIFSIQAITSTFSSNITISGSKTPNLTITSNAVSTNNVRCKVSHPTACNTLTSSIFTRTANFSVVDPRKIINIELLPGAGGSATLYSWNLFDQGSFNIGPSDIPTGSSMCFYSPEKDIDVFIDMYANAGANNGGYSGGQGGVSTIQFTLKQNEEYQIMSLSQSNNGSSIFIYNKSRLIAVAGGGGNAGSNGNGGDGGGVNVAGGNGSGRGAGTGGQLYLPGTLPSTGIFGSAANIGSSSLKSGDGSASGTSGGRTLPCPRGDYWYNLGYSACQNMGNVQFYTSSAGVIPNSTSSITRGFKAGYGIRQTAGAGANGGGQGGNGATGGNGGDGGGGGGGGSGYSDGSIKIISTQQGGNTGAGRVVIRSAN